MRVACLAVVVVIAAFAIHWTMWRIRIPRRQTFVLLVIFTTTLLVGLTSAAGLSIFTGYSLCGLHGFWECLQVAIFHIAWMLAYVVAYSALEERSPSMAILTQIANSKKQGRSREELEENFKGFCPIEIRVNAMIRDHMIDQLDGDYALTAKGRQWARVFSTWRTLLGFAKGG